MGLKYSDADPTHVNVYQLKSDQNGIEITGRLWCQTRARRLKSDQNGIEMIGSSLSGLRSGRVKIRPKWD